MDDSADTGVWEEMIRKWWFFIKHQFFDFTRFIGMRDRLRCPYCKAVGTWKPHGGWIDGPNTSGRRWTCKWCGKYESAVAKMSSLIRIRPCPGYEKVDPWVG